RTRRGALQRAERLQGNCGTRSRRRREVGSGRGFELLRGRSNNNVRNEGASGSIRCEFEDQATARNKEIARTVEDQVAGVADPGGEGALSIRCEFEDRIAARGRHKEMSRSAKDEIDESTPVREG